MWSIPQVSNERCTAVLMLVEAQAVGPGPNIGRCVSASFDHVRHAPHDLPEAIL